MSKNPAQEEPRDRSDHSSDAHYSTENENSKDEIPQNSKIQSIKSRRPNFDRSPTADSVFANISGDPKTTRQLDSIMAQLGPDGQAQLADLASRFASGARRKGRIDEMEAYCEQNPWYDTPRERPVFSLGEPFPRKGGNDQESPSLAMHDNRTKDKPVFSLGEPLPRKVRKSQREEAAAKQKAEDDVEQGFQQRLQRDETDQTTPDSDEMGDTGETFRGSLSRESMSPMKTKSNHRNEQDQGTDMAQKYRVSDTRLYIHVFPVSNSNTIT